MGKVWVWTATCALALATIAAPVAARDRDDRDDRRGHQSYRGDDRGRNQAHVRDHRRDRSAHDQRRAQHRGPDDGRYDRADLNRSRHAAYQRASYRRAHAPPPRTAYYRTAPMVRHAAPPHWARGGYVHHYERPVYVVHDYRHRGLRHPPHGHHWVRDDYGDLLLVAVATGLITELILGSR